jgi:phosphatidylglycerol---prolipoprotein diacylglyceryl transferase
MIWEIDPVMLEIGSIQIHYYGLFFAVSLLLAYIFAHYMCRKSKLDTDKLDELFIFAIIGLLIGARFSHILFYNLDFYAANPTEMLKIWQGGLSSHGGGVGAFLGFLAFIWHNRDKAKPFAKQILSPYLDILAVVASFPIAFVRLGNFFNSEIVGRPSDLPWSVIFPRVDEVSRHPSQIYEFLIGAAIFAILFTLWKKNHKKSEQKSSRKSPTGFFLALLLTLYFTARFLVEFAKEYPTHSWALEMTTGQILSLPFLATGIYMLVKLHKPKLKTQKKVSKN